MNSTSYVSPCRLLKTSSRYIYLHAYVAIILYLLQTHVAIRHSLCIQLLTLFPPFPREPACGLHMCVCEWRETGWGGEEMKIRG